MSSRLFFLYFKEAERISIEKQYQMCQVALLPYQKEETVNKILKSLENDLKKFDQKEEEEINKDKKYDAAWNQLREHREKLRGAFEGGTNSRS